MSLCLADDYNSFVREQSAGDARAERLRVMLQRSYSAEDEPSAAMQLNDFLRLLTERELGDLVKQRQISGPLAHLLSKFLQSANPTVVHNAAIILSQMMREDGTRVMLCKSGLHTLILKRLQQQYSKDSRLHLTREICNDLYASVQNVLLEGEHARDFAANGGLLTLGSALQDCLSDAEQRNAELEIRLLACMTNAMSHTQRELESYTHEMRSWIASLIQVLDKVKLPADKEAAQYCVCAIANASRDPGLLHCIRASNGAEGLERIRFGDEPKISQVASIVLGRLQFNGLRSAAAAAAGKAGGEEDEIFRFRYGGGRITQQQQALGMVALLTASTACCAILFLLLWHLLSSASYF